MASIASTSAFSVANGVRARLARLAKGTEQRGEGEAGENEDCVFPEEGMGRHRSKPFQQMFMTLCLMELAVNPDAGSEVAKDGQSERR